MAASEQREMSLAAEQATVVQEALTGALRLAASLDAVEGAKANSNQPEASGLTKLIARALGVMGGVLEAAPAENVDRHAFPIERLTPDFLNALLRERGWQQAKIVVGSAQSEALARRVLSGIAPGALGASTVRLHPFSANQPVSDLTAQGWALVEDTLE